MYKKKYSIFLLILFICNGFLFSQNINLSLIDSIYTAQNISQKIKYINTLDDSILKDAILNDLIIEILKNKPKQIKIIIKQYIPQIDSLIYRKSQYIDDIDICNYLNKKGYSIKNIQFYIKQIEKNKKEYIKKIIYDYPHDKKTQNIFFNSINTLNKKDIVFFAIHNMNKQTIDSILLYKNNYNEIYFLKSILYKDSTYIKLHTNENTKIIEKLPKKYKVFLGQFIKDNVNSRILYYRGLYYEDKQKYFMALKIYDRIKDEEAIIRIIAKIGEKYGRYKSDSLLLSLKYTFSSFLYHKSKTLYYRGAIDSAKTIFEYIYNNDKLSYYGVRSAYLLHKTLNIDNNKHYNIKYYTMMYEEFDKLHKRNVFFNYIYSLYKKQILLPLKIAYLYKKIGIYQKSIFYGYRAYFENKNNTESINYIFIYPYYSIFKKYSSKNNIDIFLLYAIAREESCFNPNAISPVGAKGIMQIMDFVYNEYFDDNDFFDIEKNIAIGSKHLKRYLNDNQNNLAYGIMSYNAGPGNVITWNRKHIDWELYLEMIPFRETRIFIKNVLRSYYFYKLILRVS